MLGTAVAREAVETPIVLSQRAKITTDDRVVQFNSPGEGGEPCITEYIPTRDARGWYLRQSVDCIE